VALEQPKGKVVLLPAQREGLARLPVKGAIGITQDANVLHLDFGFGIQLDMGPDGFILLPKNYPQEQFPC
jgi:hypothetical protein